MPTAVELIARLLRNSLKLDVVDSPFAQRFISSIDDEIGPAFRALDGASTRDALRAAEHRYGHVVEALGDGSVFLGFELQHDAGVLNNVNKLLNGAPVSSGDGGGSGRGGLVSDIFSGQGGGSGRGLTEADIYTGGGGGSGVPAAFGALNLDLLHAGADLKQLGADLVRLGHVRSVEALHSLERQIGDDVLHATDDFVAMGDDAQHLARTFGGANGIGDDKLVTAFMDISAKSSKIGVDFGAIADIFSGQGGGSGFQAMEDDMLKFDTALQRTSGPLAGLLVPAVHTVT